MAPKPTEEETRVDNATEKALLHDFVYRDGMSVDDIAEHLGRDWEDTYNTLNDLLNQVEDDD